MNKVLKVLKQGSGILVGSIFFGIGLSWFLIPFKIVPGGVAGIGQIFFHLMGINTGISMIIMNVPLLFIGIMIIGKQFGFGTFIGFFSSALMVDLSVPARLYKWGFFTSLIDKYNTVNGVMLPESSWAMTDEIILAVIAGSIFLGIGIGIIFKSRASTGGTDIPVAIMKKRLNISIGNGYLIVESSIIIITGLIFGDLNIIIWSFFALYLTSRFADIITEGLSRVKAATIICTSLKAEEKIKNRIYEELDRGVTYIKGEGSFSGNKKNILFTAFNRRQSAQLRYITKEEDPGAFMIFHDIHDVIGFGFKSRELDIE